MSVKNIVILLFVLEKCLCFPMIAKQSEACGEEVLINHHGILKSPNYPEKYPENTYCSWTLRAPSKSTITVVITDLDIDDNCQQHRNCCEANNRLTVANEEFCGIQLQPQKISISQPLMKISFEATHNNRNRKGFRLIFSIRNETHCLGYDLPCANNKGCFNSKDICNLQFECADHSDEMNCSKCGSLQTSCNISSDNCFDPLTEHCDGVLNCPGGEDEQNCTELCPNRIVCQNGTGCYDKHTKCDGYLDCADHSDEINCNNKSCKKDDFLCNNGRCINPRLVNNGNNDCEDFSDEIKSSAGNLFMYVFLLTFSLAICFLLLICRWMSIRRNIQHLMTDVPEFPLPSLGGLEQRSNESFDVEFSTSDFLHGGEIYDAFLQTRQTTKDNAQNRCIPRLVLPREQRQLRQFYGVTCTSAALQSLGIYPQETHIRNDLLEPCNREICEFCYSGSEYPTTSDK